MSVIATVKTHSGVRFQPRREQEQPAAVLGPREGGLSERLGALADGHPVVTFFLVMLGGLVVIAGLSILLGLLVTHVVETGSVGAADERVNVWLAAHRTPTRTDASLIGSIVAGGVVLPIIVGVLALVAAIFRKWALVAFFIFTLAVESATYRATTLVVHSQRPRVHRLEGLPVNASYPSGHTAAAIAVYGGLALLITSRFRDRTVRIVTWLLAVGMVAFVGIAALCVLVLACRSAKAAAK